jgi:hypothetical protein
VLSLPDTGKKQTKSLTIGTRVPFMKACSEAKLVSGSAQLKGPTQTVSAIHKKVNVSLAGQLAIGGELTCTLQTTVSKAMLLQVSVALKIKV